MRVSRTEWTGREKMIASLRLASLVSYGTGAVHSTCTL